jgi:hypothetical protein
MEPPIVNPELRSILEDSWGEHSGHMDLGILKAFATTRDLTLLILYRCRHHEYGVMFPGEGAININNMQTKNTPSLRPQELP